MKFHIEFDEKDIEKFIDKFGEELLEKILPKLKDLEDIVESGKKELDDALLENSIKDLLERITWDEKREIDLVIQVLNGLIDATGRATMLHFVSYASNHEPDLKEISDKKGMMKYGWNKPLGEDDIVDGVYGYYINGNSIVKLS